LHETRSIGEVVETLFLTPNELAELTGRTSSAGQRKWLDTNGYRFALNANNRPVVAREYVLSRLGVMQADSDVGNLSIHRPNFNALSKAF